jgi:hypothetical protein
VNSGYTQKDSENTEESGSASEMDANQSPGLRYTGRNSLAPIL